jgi:glycosyltransferase involved in cell wall biosynthesis
MSMARRRLLHAIHDFLPRHRAGSEIYASELATELARRHDVFVVAAEYDPSAVHGALRWRRFGELTVIELINNWQFRTFAETYAPPRLNRQLEHVLDATRPDVLHFHNLMNLSFDLPRLAGERRIPVVATLHDYTLVCASGGQRVHAAESHVCHTIDPERCSRCFAQSPFHSMLAGGAAMSAPGGRTLGRAAALFRRYAPALVERTARRLPAPRVGPSDISARLQYARSVFDHVDLFVAPSRSLAAEYVRLGVDEGRLEVLDHGFHRTAPAPRVRHGGPLVIGFVGTIVWHKGVHVLVGAARRLSGDAVVHVYGDPAVSPSYFDRLQRAAPARVRFMGPFDRDRVAEVYGGIDVLVVPSLWPENSPLVIHEAFMHGVPVVGSRMGGIPELVHDDVNGFVYDAASPEALAGLLQRLVDDRPLRERLAAHVPAVKPIESHAVEWEERYERVLAAPRRLPSARVDPAVREPVV